MGDSAAAKRARAQADLAARSCASVVIVGPQGSGRQHLASVIHYAANPEGAGPLVPLDCSVLDSELIRSTLAALAGRRIPETVPGSGTLLLNEADQLPSDAQHEVARVIGGRAFPLRVIATARRRLGDLVAEGSYREDLASLLSTLVIELPALARRAGDLPMLLQWFVEESNVRNHKQLAGFTPDALDLLNAHPWPGNLNELVRVVEEAHGHADGPEIGVADLPDSIRQTARAAAYPRRQEERIVLDEFLTQVERELLRRAMRQAKGNKAKAAKLLGISRPRLYHRLMQLNLEAGEKPQP